MTTAEVADYLRLKQRKIYELVRTRQIPCSHATGKLLFPKQAIDLWLARNLAFEGPELRSPPPIAAGSHDPLLEWALRESGCELALLAGGSQDGLRRLIAGQAVVAGLHIVDETTGEYNLPQVGSLPGLHDLVLVEWAMRGQGLVVAAENPARIAGLGDVAARRLRVARRQDGAGAQFLLHYLLAREGLHYQDLNVVEPPALTETDLAGVVLDGTADCGIAIEAVARRYRLGFLPLHRERFDLALRRRDYFEPPVQALLRFARSPAFRAKAAELGGYDISDLGRIVFNA
ncbi:MAG TPA: helix-turn-helix transcriptional regulator [Chloroflexota bacterium]|nr:helix-turn-helix transcriptional regulator [Chloroflexota bacterium]